MISLQQKFAPKSICYGCGPSNAQGFQIQSIDRGEFVECDWFPQAYHQAFPGIINGGVIGTLLDCHSNWTAAFHLMKKWGMAEIPCTVTAEYTIALNRPTPGNTFLHLRAKVIEYVNQDRALIYGELLAGDKVTATCRGLFVAVKEGHPAYHRWS